MRYPIYFIIVSWLFGALVLGGCTSSSDIVEVDNNGENIYENIHDGQSEQETADTQPDTTVNVSDKARLLTRKGDYYYFKNYRDSALRSYQVAHLLTGKEDPEIAMKIANIYFEDKQFKDAITYYEPILSTLSEEEKIKYAWSLSYAQDEGLLQKLANLNLSEEVQAYFELIHTCQQKTGDCEEEILAYPYEYEPVDLLKTSIENFAALGSEDDAYKRALLMGVFAQNKDYTSVIKAGEKILETRPDYLSVLKLTGYAYHEIGEFREAIKLLSGYYEVNPEDPQVAFLLGSAHFEKKDYVTANIYINKSIQTGYEPQVSALRKLAYNYFVLKLDKNMFQTLHQLLENEEAQHEDFTNAIYLAIEGEDLRKASMWSELAQEKFPESSEVLGLGGWQAYLSGDTQGAREMLEKAIEMNKRNALAYFQLGVIAFDQAEYKPAQKYFSQTSLLDNGGMFGEQVDEYLTQILEKCEQEGCEDEPKEPQIEQPAPESENPNF